jgi:5-methylcytosine-specific restriction protein A
MTSRSNQRTEEARRYRNLYKTASWQALRMRAFIRDLYICQICGRPASPRHMDPHAAVADHIKDHKGSAELFFDLDNIRTLGKSCHDRHAQRQAHGTMRQQIGADGWPI